MTRFARAKGSKASNERVPESSTPWSEMKQQLVDKQQETGELKKKHESDKQREENYRRFLEEVEEEKTKNTEWAEFPTEKSQKKKGTDSEGKSVKLKKINVEADEVVVKKKEKKKRKVDIIEDDSSEPTKSKKKKRNAVENKETEDEENQEQVSEGKFEKKNKPKPVKVTTRKGLKAKQNPNKKGDKQPAEKKPLTEEDLKKIEKKKEKKIKQIEKRKQHKNPTSITPAKTKKFQHEKPERRKKCEETMMINGKAVEIMYYDGFPIKKEDALHIQQLRKEMISKGLPRSEIKITLKLERRKAEKALAREKKKVCFNCRKSGHNLSECPELGNSKEIVDTSATGICFKCGSTEHTHFECKVVRKQEFKFAQCFICHEQGHIARQCPDNARGLYPKGGACRVCGDVTHLKKDCPKFHAQQEQLQDAGYALGMMRGHGENPDSLEDENVPVNGVKRMNKIIKF